MLEKRRLQELTRMQILGNLKHVLQLVRLALKGKVTLGVFVKINSCLEMIDYLIETEDG